MHQAGDYSSLWAWEELSPQEVAELLEGFDRPWWIAGGWALDLFLGRETRRHDDLDVAILRHDQAALYRYLSGWDLRFATADHVLQAWDGSHLDPPIHGIWARRSQAATAPWTCEFLLNEHRADRWVFRRNHAVTCPLLGVGAQRSGIPFLRPEIVLLYKSGEPSPKNDSDFAATLGQLSRDQQLWLRAAIETCDPRHHWIPQISRWDCRQP